MLLDDYRRERGRERGRERQTREKETPEYRLIHHTHNLRQRSLHFSPKLFNVDKKKKKKESEENFQTNVVIGI